MSQFLEESEGVWGIAIVDLLQWAVIIRRPWLVTEHEQFSPPLPASGLEPEIQKLISKHKQELKKLRTLHEAELLQADDRAAHRYVRQCEELRQQLEREKEEQCHKERELAKQRLAINLKTSNFILRSLKSKLKETKHKLNKKQLQSKWL